MVEGPTSRERAKAIIARFVDPQPPALYPLIEQFAPPNVMDDVLRQLEDAITDAIDAAVRECHARREE